MSLREAYFRYAVREDNEAAGLEQWAKQIYDAYQKEYADGSRTALPPFDLIRYLSLTGFMEDGFYPQNLKSRLFARIKVEKPELFDKLAKQEKIFQELINRPPPNQQNP
jgi:hypothetical protein